MAGARHAVAVGVCLTCACTGGASMPDATAETFDSAVAPDLSDELDQSNASDSSSLLDEPIALDLAGAYVCPSVHAVRCPQPSGESYCVGATPVCCYEPSTSQGVCVAVVSACTSDGGAAAYPYACDGDEDCPAGEGCVQDRAATGWSFGTTCAKGNGQFCCAGPGCCVGNGVVNFRGCA